MFFAESPKSEMSDQNNIYLIFNYFIKPENCYKCSYIFIGLFTILEKNVQKAS